MKQLIAVILFVVLVLCGCAQEIIIDESSIVTQTGTVTDRAMAFPDDEGKIWDESYPYLGIEFEDGFGLCIWNKNDVDVSEQIAIGSVVEVTYGLEENSIHWILIDIKEAE